MHKPCAQRGRRRSGGATQRHGCRLPPSGLGLLAPAPNDPRKSPMPYQRLEGLAVRSLAAGHILCPRLCGPTGLNEGAHIKAWKTTRLHTAVRTAASAGPATSQTKNPVLCVERMPACCDIKSFGAGERRPACGGCPKRMSSRDTSAHGHVNARCQFT
jgi:hypothetical protein